jgi:hypothetical protein
MNKEMRKDFLEKKKQLQEIEKDILLDNKDYEDLVYRLQERLLLLNQMFSLHATETEIRRLTEVNDKLHQLEIDYLAWDKYVHASFKKLKDIEGEQFLIETELCPNIKPSLNCKLHIMEEDFDYGSRWQEMIGVIGRECTGKILPVISAQNKISMNIGAVKYVKQMDDMCVTELFWQLTDKFYLSVPDILKIQHYHYHYGRYCNAK